MRITLAAAVACFALGGVCTAHDASAAIKRTTDIPAQRLAPALQTLVKERDIQLVYRAELIGDRRTAGASGELTAVETLARLLDGTGLTYQYLDDRTITILPAPSGKAKVSSGPASRSESSSTRDLNDSGREAPKQSFWDRFRLAQRSEVACPRCRPPSRQRSRYFRSSVACV